MTILLGNLSIKEIEHRVGINFPVELIEFMNPRRQENASNIGPGKWHCFDAPFNLVCGDEQTAISIFKHLKPMSKDFKQQLEISLQTF